ncbi:zinc finger MYM-type protein 1-like [Rhinoderma darwinii]|uniref:zinc finger MYM-type protein 1-like n=1 Tax=Rhinoderma darwinii TaxID=43563 RepID=UPI003F6739C3
MSDVRKRLSGAAYRKLREAKKAALIIQKGAIRKFLHESSEGQNEYEGLGPDVAASCSFSSSSPAVTEELSRPSSPSSPVSYAPELHITTAARRKVLVTAAKRYVEVPQRTVSTLTLKTEIKVEENSDDEVTEWRQTPSEAASEFSNSLLHDPGLWPKKSKKLREFLILNGPQQIMSFTFPKDKRNRSFDRKHYRRELPNREMSERQWLMYSTTNNSVYCLCCKLFHHGSDESGLCTTGTSVWKNLSRNLASHEKTEYHERAFLKWKDLETRLRLNVTIEDTKKELIASETQHWQNVLKRLIVLIRTMAVQNVAFGGRSQKLYEANNGNFLKFVEAMAEFDAVLDKHLKRITNHSVHTHYLGSGTQNEIVQLLATQIKRKILEQLNAAKYYSVILDCTPDRSHKEQMTLTVRFVTVKESYGNEPPEVKIKEHFLGFLEIDDSAGSGMTKVLLQSLQENGIDIKDMRGQGYDNGSDMKGRINGVQAGVRHINPRAFYVPCNSHPLNLVVSDAASACVEAVEFFNIIQSLYVFFSVSAHRWAILQYNLGASHESLSLSTTRWESRVEAVRAIRNQISKIDDALTDVMEDSTLQGAALSKTVAEIRGIRKNICNFTFLCGLVTWYDILFEINIASKKLQEIDLDISGAMKQLETCKLFLQRYCSDEQLENIIREAQGLAAALEIEGDFPPAEEGKTRRRKRRFDCESQDEPIRDPKQLFKVGFFTRILDSAVQTVQDRILQLTEHRNAFGVLYNLQQIKDLTQENLREQCDHLEKRLSHDHLRDIDGADLCYELKSLSRYVPANCYTPKSVLGYICRSKMSTMFPNTCIALRILLSLPVTVASGDRSFSKLELVKTYLRSTPPQERLVGLATISIEHELAYKLDLDDAIQAFASQKARRAPIT